MALIFQLQWTTTERVLARTRVKVDRCSPKESTATCRASRVNKSKTAKCEHRETTLRLSGKVRKSKSDAFWEFDLVWKKKISFMKKIAHYPRSKVVMLQDTTQVIENTQFLNSHKSKIAGF